jgi:hypothetical protein
VQSRGQLLLIGLVAWVGLVAIYLAWGLVGQASWGFLCFASGEVDFGSASGCTTTVWPDLTYGEQEVLGLDLLTFWLLFIAPLAVGLLGVVAGVLSRSRAVLVVGLSTSLALLILSAIVVHLSPGADWEFLSD